MVRAAIQNRILNAPEFFKPFEIVNDVRPDRIAEAVYEDSYMSWLVYLSNQIVDPYYDWPLSQYDFDEFIKQKYGSIATAQSKVAYWSNNWYDDPNNISVSFYNNTLQGDLKKYYQPVIGGNKILEYKRREIDNVVNTNQIWEYSVSSDDDIVFDIDEKVNLSTYANGQVLFANTSVVRIQHVFGETDPEDSNLEIIGASGTVTVEVDSATNIANNISEVERVYWSPITYYDVEETKNNSKRNIQLLSNEHSIQAALELRENLIP